MFGWLRNIIGSGSSKKPDIEFYSSIVGVSHKNRDRTSRQKIIRESLHPNTKLELVLENDNPVDKNAVALLAPNGGQVGYLSSGLAKQVRGWMRDGMQVTIIVKEITGGTRDKPTYGVNILVQAYERTVEGSH